MLAAAEFEGTRTAGYLDTATYGLPPRSTLAALEAAMRAWRDGEDWLAWEREGERCRELFARIVGAPAESIALVGTVSAAAGIVAASLPAGPGDNVVGFEHEFQSALFPWLALEERGVEVRLCPLEALADAVDARTQLVAVSVVQSSDGRVADLDALKDAGAPLFLDATQSAGALPVDLEGVDFLVAGGYKWLLCPRGLSFLYVRPERLLELEPWHAGWKSIDDVYERFYGLPKNLTADARRLDTSLAWLVAAGSRASLELIDALGVGRIAEHNRSLVARFCAGLGIPETGSSIVQVERPDAEAAMERLRAAGISCSVRAGALRLAFHLYNDEADVERALEVLGSPAGDFSPRSRYPRA
jgi:selenocysteine lyase/cysteine desulfurase